MGPEDTNDIKEELDRISVGVPVSDNTGDIILNKAPSAGNAKKPLLIIVIFMVVLALGLIVFLVLRSTGILTGGLPPEYADAYNSYASYLINGDNKDNLMSVDSALQNKNNIYPFSKKAEFSRSENQQMEQYFEELYKRFEDLKSKTDSNNEDIQSAISENEVFLGIVEKTANHSKYLKSLRKAYDENQNQIEKTINDTFKYDGDDPFLMTATEKQKEFYLSYIKEYSIYRNNGCYKNNYYDFECMVRRGHDAAALREKSAEVSSAYGAMSDDGLASVLSHKMILLTLKMGGKNVTPKK